MNDYEYYYTGRAQADFTDQSTYLQIVGNIEQGQYADPVNDDSSLLGATLNIRDMQTHLSVVYIDALRDVHSELRKARNPIMRIMDTLESKIQESDIKNIESIISELNKAISGLQTINTIGKNVNSRLHNMIGHVYSPDLKLHPNSTMT